MVNYYKTGCLQHQTLLNELEKLDNDQPATGEPTVPLALKNVGSALTVARYNKAVIYFHRHMYGTALDRLAPLVTRLEALEKQMAALVATLQLQLLLATNQLNRAEAFLDYLQYKLNLVASAPGASPSSSLEEPTTTTATASTAAAAASGAASTTAPTAVASATPILDSSVTRAAGENGSILRLLQLLTHVLNRKPVVITEDGTPEIAALKAQQYYIMKDFQMAAKQLMRINDDCTQAG